MLSKKICQYLIDFLVGSLWVQSEGADRYAASKPLAIPTILSR